MKEESGQQEQQEESLPGRGNHSGRKGPEEAGAWCFQALEGKPAGLRAPRSHLRQSPCASAPGLCGWPCTL